MFKWILILLLLLLAMWLFAKDYIPQSVVQSGIGKKIDVTLYPLNKKIKEGKFSRGKFDNNIVTLDESRFIKVLATADSKQKPVVIYFYTSNCFVCRMVFNQVNELAESHKEALFLVVDFDEDEKNNRFFLNTMDNLYFRPFKAPASEIKTAQYFYQKKEIGFNESPVLLYKNKAGGYENVGVEFGSKARLEELIGK